MVNYRPILILTSFSKVFEIMYARLLYHININDMLVDEQFWFWTKLSIEKAFFKLLNEISNAFNSRLIVADIFFDMGQAFDYVSHDIEF